MRVRHWVRVGSMRAAFAVALAVVACGCGLFADGKAKKPREKVGPDLSPSGVPVISAGNGHSCGLHGSGSLYCWGQHADEAPHGSYRRIAAGFEHACALRAEAPRQGEIECWGRDDVGQAKPPRGVFIELAAGYDHSCALRPDGTALCWGGNGQGQAKPPATRFTQLSAGKGFTCGLTRDKAIECWGRNDKNQTNASVGGTFVQLSSGPSHSCAVSSEGELSCWGDDAGGQLKAPAGKYRAVAAGLEHSCALRDDGKLGCWGGNAEGQAKAPEGEFVAIAAGWLHSCAIASSGDVTCWGKNYFGEAEPHAQFQHVNVRGGKSAGGKLEGESARAAKVDEEPAGEGKDKPGKQTIAAADAAPQPARGGDKRKSTQGEAQPASGSASGADMAFDLEEAEAGASKAKKDEAEQSADEERTRREDEKKKKKPLDYFLK